MLAFARVSDLSLLIMTTIIRTIRTSCFEIVMTACLKASSIMVENSYWGRTSRAITFQNILHSWKRLLDISLCSHLFANLYTACYQRNEEVFLELSPHLYGRLVRAVYKTRRTLGFTLNTFALDASKENSFTRSSCCSQTHLSNGNIQNIFNSASSLLSLDILVTLKYVDDLYASLKVVFKLFLFHLTDVYIRYCKNCVTVKE